MTFIEVERDGVNGVDGLGGAAGVALSPDGNHVYAAGSFDSALAVFARDAASGEVAFVERVHDAQGDGLAGIVGLALSPDGRHLYSAAFFEDKLRVFARTPRARTLGSQARVLGAGGADSPRSSLRRGTKSARISGSGWDR